MLLKTKSRRSLVESLESRQMLATTPVRTAAAAALASSSPSSSSVQSTFSASAVAAATSATPSAVTQRSVYLTGNSLTDGINYAGLAAMLGLDNSTVTWGRQTGSGYTQASNLDLRSGYFTGGYNPATPTNANPWGNYQLAFAARSWDALTLQPQERHLLNETYNVGTPAEQNEAEVPISIAFMKALAANSPNGQVYIYERPARRDDVNADLTATGDTEHYSETWLQTYNDSVSLNQPFISRSFFQQLMPLLSSAQAADATTAAMPPVKIIPVGEAYYNIDQMFRAGKFAGTGLSSILDLYRDQSHPTADLGSYVIALTFYSTLTGNDPRGNPPPSQYLFAGSRLVDPKVQALLQQAVYDAITSPLYAGYTTALPATPPKQGTIVANAYVDANYSSTHDTGDQPLAGVQVYLDANNNGVLDTGEATQATDATGAAIFTGLPAGSYVVRSTATSGYDITAAFSTVSLDGVSTRTTEEGLAPQIPTGTGLPTGNSTLSGNIVEDTNHDRQWSAGEVGIAGRTVWIDLNDDGIMQNAEPRTVTNSAGKFSFKVPAGSYRLREVIPTGWVQEVPSGTASLGFTVADGGTKNINFLGYTPVQTANIGQIAVTVYNDVDANATFSTGDVLLAGIPVFIDLNGNGVFDSGEPSASTNSSGVATFTGLTPGSYALRTRPVTGLVASTPQPLTVTNDGLTTTSISLGLAPAVAGKELITLYSDTNKNGVQDVGEAVLSGVTLYIDANSNGQLDSGELTAVTDATGVATFDRLLAGTYTALAVTPAGYAASPAVTFSSDGASTLSTSLALTPAPVQSNNGSISVSTFNDANGNGALDTGEAALGNVTVYLDANNNGIADTGETSIVSNATTGIATFTGLAAGTYTFRVIAPSGYHTTTTLPITLTSDGATATSASLGLAADVVTPPADPATVTIEAEAGTVGGGTWATANHANYTGTGFLDYAGDGSSGQWTITRNAAGTATLSFRYSNGGAGDRPMTIFVNGVSLGLLSMPSTGNWDTWKNASISITLAAGVNTIKAVAGPATGGNVDSLTITSTGTVTPPPATGTISGFAFVDADSSGAFNTGDTLAAGATVFLDSNDNGVLDTGETSATTLADGSYSFTGLSAGTYKVREVIPSGYLASVIPTAITLTAGQTVGSIAVGVKPQPVVTPTATTIEAESGTFGGGTYATANHANYTGTGFADYGGSGSFAQWTVTRTAAGAATLTFRYANGGSADRPVTVFVNGVSVGLVSMAATGNWDTWKNTASLTIALNSGANVIKAVAGDATGANVDSLTIS